MEDSCQICRHVPNAEFNGGAKKCVEKLRTLLFEHFDVMAESYNEVTLKNRTLQKKVDSLKEELRELRGHLELRGFSDVEQTESEASSAHSLLFSPNAFRSPTHDATDDEDGGAVKESEYIRTPRVFERSDDSHAPSFCVPDDSFRKRSKRHLSLRSRNHKKSQPKSPNRKSDSFKRDDGSVTFDNCETMMDTMLEMTPSNPSVMIVDKPREIISIDTTVDCSGIGGSLADVKIKAEPKDKWLSPVGPASPIKIKMERPSPVKGSPLRMCQPSAQVKPLRKRVFEGVKSFNSSLTKNCEVAAAQKTRSPDDVKPIVGNFRQDCKPGEENRNWCDSCLRLKREIHDPEMLQHELRNCWQCCNDDFETTPRDFWNPLLPSFATEDPRNVTLEDNRFVGLQRKGKFGSFK